MTVLYIYLTIGASLFAYHGRWTFKKLTQKWGRRTGAIAWALTGVVACLVWPYPTIYLPIREKLERRRLKRHLRSQYGIDRGN